MNNWTFNKEPLPRNCLNNNVLKFIYILFYLLHINVFFLFNLWMKGGLASSRSKSVKNLVQGYSLFEIRNAII